MKKYVIVQFKLKKGIKNEIFIYIVYRNTFYKL